ncbi:MAG: hypothetical protein ACN2B6_08745 [Rickettsiales bacterium]
MYSFILFALTIIQLLIMGISYAMSSAEIFYNMAVYGAPFYLLMNMLGNASAFLDSNPLYLGMAAYHFVKYCIFFLAQRNEGFSFMMIAAILFEAIYLCTSAYYMELAL